MGARMLGGGSAGFALSWGMQAFGPVNAEEQVEKQGSTTMLGLSGVAWPPPVLLDNAKYPPIEDEKSSHFFADARMHVNPSTGPLAFDWKMFRLEQVLPINHDTAKFVFSFSDPDIEFSLLPCSTLQLGLRLSQTNQAATRLYTPITPNKTKGGFECVIKYYPQGCFTPELFKKRAGDVIHARIQHLKLKYKKGDYDNIGLIAGGTGIAPMLQIIRAVLSEPEDQAKISLLFCNKTAKDILMREELDTLAQQHPDRFKVTYALQRPPLGWEGEVGYVSHAMVARTMPQPGVGRVLVALSGPDRMMAAVGGSGLQNMIAWRGNDPNMMVTRHTRRLQCAAPSANHNGVMRCGILYECGFEDHEVYKF